MQKDVKKILIVSSTFYPQNSPRSFRTTELVKEFSRQGHDVTLLTPKNDELHIPFEKEHKVVIKDLGKRKFTDISLTSKNKYVFLFKRVFRRLLNLFFEFPDIELMFKVKSKLKNESGYDLMISIAVPHPNHWGVAWARTKKNPIAKIWVADCGDPYMMANFDTFKKMFYFKYLEKWFCKKADYISVPKDEYKVNFYEEFASKIITIPQGFNFNGIKITQGEPKNTVPTFAFAGRFMKGFRDPGKLLEYLTTLDKPFKLVMYVEQNDFVEPYKNLLKEKLEIKEFIPREKLLYELSKMDFLINLEFDPTAQAPSKLIDYTFTGRPILLLQSKEFDKSIINEFLAGNYSRKFILQNFEQFNIKNVVNKFLFLL